MIEFRIISALVLIVLLTTIAFDLKGTLKSWNGVALFFVNQARASWTTWRGVKWTTGTKNLSILRRVMYTLTAVLFGLLLVSGFIPIIFLGESLSGFLLAVHVTVAPFFAVSLSGFSLLWAHRLRFDESDWRFVAGGRKRRNRNKEALVRFAIKTGFWLVLVFSLPLILTVILELFPLFGTDGEEFLIRAHGYSALLLTVAAVINIYLTVAYTKYSNV